jgi:hypothetical protein
VYVTHLVVTHCFLETFSVCSLCTVREVSSYRDAVLFAYCNSENSEPI